MIRQTAGALFLVGVIFACGACRRASAKSHIIPNGFEICETMLSGDEGPNGFDYRKQVDVGNTGEQEEEWEDEEPVDTSPFELDRQYTPQDGFGFVGTQGEAAVDPGWSNSAWRKTPQTATSTGATGATSAMIPVIGDGWVYSNCSGSPNPCVSF